MLENLKLNIATLGGRATESSGTADDEGMRAFVILHGGNKVVEGRTDPGVFVGRNYERVALAIQDSLCNFLVGVDQRDHLETGSKFVLESERVIPRSLVTSEVDVSRTDEDEVELRSRGQQSRTSALPNERNARREQSGRARRGKGER